MTATADVAGRWFAVEAEYEPVPVARRVGWRLGSTLLYLLTLCTYLAPLRQRSVVRLVRRIDGACVASYEHRRAADLEGDLAWLRARLATQHVFDFCRSIGIPMSQVEGGGADFALDAIVTAVPAQG